MITKVKICGITRREDAEAAVDAGASAIGFIFIRSSPRFIDPDNAKQIVQSLPPFVTPVGVIADSPRSEALALVAKAGVRCLQLHDLGSAKDYREFPIPYYRVFRVSPEFKLDQLKTIRGSAFMLDTFVDGKLGGTGKTFDWNVAIQAKQYGRLILSGGINPENIGEALRRVAPYAIDVNSGIEQSTGVKDREKIRLLFDAVRAAERTC